MKKSPQVVFCVVPKLIAYNGVLSVRWTALSLFSNLCPRKRISQLKGGDRFHISQNPGIVGGKLTKLRVNDNLWTKLITFGGEVVTFGGTNIFLFSHFQFHVER